MDKIIEEVGKELANSSVKELRRKLNTEDWIIINALIEENIKDFAQQLIDKLEEEKKAEVKLPANTPMTQITIDTAVFYNEAIEKAQEIIRKEVMK